MVNSKVNGMFNEALEKNNEFWISGKISPSLALPLKREAFNDVIKLLEFDRIIRLIGPRRTGKTVLLHQTIGHLLERGIAPKNIVFFAADDPAFAGAGNLLEQVLEAHQEISGKGTRYVFIDEIQKIRDWSVWLKSFYEKKLEIKFIVSGSSAAKMKNEEKDSLLGRIFDLFIPPLSFKEFIRFNSSKANASAEKNLLQEYLMAGGYPEWLKVRDLTRWQQFLVQDVLKKAIYDDLISLYQIKMPQKIEQLLYFIAKQQNQTISIHSLANTLDLDFETTQNYLHYLKDAYLIYERRYYSYGGEKTVKKNYKYTLNDTGLRNALIKATSLNSTELGFAAEAVCMQHLNALAVQKNYSLYYWKNGKEIDFVLQTPGELIPIEVKYANEVTAQDTQALREFKQRHDCKQAIIVTKNTQKTLDGITHTPLHEFLKKEF